VCRTCVNWGCWVDLAAPFENTQSMLLIGELTLEDVFISLAR
jgi:hypothetical protein